MMMNLALHSVADLISRRHTDIRPFAWVRDTAHAARCSRCIPLYSIVFPRLLTPRQPPYLITGTRLE